jgi:hypothetical protein
LHEVLAGSGPAALDAINLQSRHFPSLTVKYSSAVQILALISASLLILWFLIMEYLAMPGGYLKYLNLAT